MKYKSKKICIVGTGYVGLVSGVCFTEIGHRVICIDNNEGKIKNLQKGICPIYEPGLDKMILKNKKAGKLSFTVKLSDAVKKSDIIFIAVHTPTKKNGEIDLRYVEDVSKKVAMAMDGYKIIISKSTMPVGTGQKIKEILEKNCKNGIKFDVVSNPEFLKEGTAVKDFLEPDRIVVGLETEKARKIIADIYKPINAPIIFTDIESAEIIKHACNSFLTTKISFINAIANICEKNHGNVEEVAKAMGLDKRIGPDFLKAGIGFGGSCFPKDLAAFINIAGKCGYDFKLLKAVKEINDKQKENFIKRIEEILSGVRNKKIAVLGLSFKPNTDDMREAPSIGIINALVNRGAIIKAYDPAAVENAKNIFGKIIFYCKNPYETAEDCDALVFLTEWPEFSDLDFKKIKRLLKRSVIIDGRNIFEPQKMLNLGFDYYSIGRKRYEKY